MKMKRTLCLLLALLMALSLLSGCAENVQIEHHSVPMDDLPEEHAEQEEKADPLAEPTEVPATEEPEAEPTEVPATEEPEAEPTEVPATEEPEAEPTEVPATEEPEAEPTEVPATEEPEAVPTEVPATEEPEAEPTEVPVTEPPEEEPEEEPEEGPASAAAVSLDEPEAVSLPESSADHSPVVTYVTMDCNGGSIEGITQFQADVVDGKLVDGFNGFNDKIRRDGYRFKGWFTERDGGEPCQVGMEVSGAATFYAHWVRVVTLDAGPGNFWEGTVKANNYTRTVELDENGCLPTEQHESDKENDPSKMPIDPLYNIDNKGEKSVVFDGWYTAKTTVKEVPAENGEYATLTIQPSGQKIGLGGKVSEDVTVLYAGYKFADGVSEDMTRKVTFYYDWNGVDGMWGRSMASTRSYSSEDHGYKLAVEDLAIAGLNWKGDDSAVSSWEALRASWANGTFDGYAFKGWALEPQAETPNVTAGVTVIKNGQSLYAVWEKDEESSATFERIDPNAGPVTGLRIVGVTGDHSNGSMTWSTHAKGGNSIQFNAFTSPSQRSTFKTLTWMVSNGNEKTELSFNAETGAGETVTLGNVQLTASGRNLSVQYISGNEPKNSTSLTVDVKVVNADESVINNPGMAATAQFSHSWDSGVVTKTATTCDEATVTTFTCSVCQATCTTEKIKQHHFSVKKDLIEPTCTTQGKYQYFCQFCGKEGGSGSIPALGHSMRLTKTEHIACNQDRVTKTCQRTGCGHEEVSTVRASNPDLHKWQNTDVTVNCQNTILRQRCSVCAKTQTLYQPTSAPDAHTYSEYTTPMNCSQSKLTRYCIWCNKIVETTVSAKNPNMPHVWGEWKTVKAATEYAGGTEERTCNLCGAKETRTTAALEGKAPAAPKPTATLKPAAAPKPTEAPKPTATLKPAAAPKPTEAPEPTATPKPAEAPEREVSEAQKAPADNGGAVASGYAANSAAPAVASADAPVASVPAANASSADAPAANASSAGASKADTAKKLSAPKNIKASLSGTSVKISWGKVTGAEKYQIFYKTGSGGWKKLTTTKSTSYTWKNAKAGTKYSFTVRCVSADGKTYTSDYDTKGVSVTTKKLATPKVSKVAKVSGGIKITWKKITGAEKYQVFYKTDSGGWKKLAVTKSTSYTWKNAKAGTYKFTVRCVSADGKTYTSSYDTKGVSFTYKK